MYDSIEDELRRVLTQRADAVETGLTTARLRPAVRRRMAVPVAIAAAAGVLTGAGAALAAPAVLGDQAAHAPAPTPGQGNALPVAAGMSTEGFAFVVRPCPAGWTAPPSHVVDPKHPEVPIEAAPFQDAAGQCLYLARPGDLKQLGR